MITSFCFVAGGSGGHSVPCLTIAYNYQQQYPDAQCIFFTSSRTLDQKIAKEYTWLSQIQHLRLTSFPGWRLWRYPSFFWLIGTAFVKAYTILRTEKPRKLISLGGFVSVPVCLAAALLRIPIELYELNAVPGKAVRLLALFAQRIFICFEQAQNNLPSEKCIFAPYPIRFSNVLSLSSKKLLAPVKNLTLLIVGGSQGSAFINSAIKKWLSLPNRLSIPFTIIHQTGAQHLDDMQRFYADAGIDAHVFDYHHQLESFYQQADIVVCRAGAGTLFELLFFNKQCITIPLEDCADNHQYANAIALAQKYPELVSVVRQHELQKDPELLDCALRLKLFHDGQPSGFEPNPNT
ncbi:MAG: UDP-N-acetylglucosamine--N-acetylmuramyl-(pentapeptide) pyrophosphoryl-undecaprenol N-acetylglucosamine transferase [Candidatus Dependentiae bacterium ADurb.Bin331]|nr:MAG: UDP-N-acetylglucosamine--N-acetylmuramyl-(pentapeptide) pyrophosphoryl-undecaprenol N-acetylglucosamine transferase [Candidatus Dependentiae bacterium ADurb.Bin331]